MFSKFPAREPRDLVCELLAKNGYESVDNFRNASVKFGMMSRAGISMLVEIDPEKLRECTQKYQQEFTAAVEFLSDKKLEGRESAGYAHAVKVIQDVFDKHPHAQNPVPKK